MGHVQPAHRRQSRHGQELAKNPVPRAAWPTATCVARARLLPLETALGTSQAARSDHCPRTGRCPSPGRPRPTVSVGIHTHGCQFTMFQKLQGRGPPAALRGRGKGAVAVHSPPGGTVPAAPGRSSASVWQTGATENGGLGRAVPTVRRGWLLARRHRGAGRPRGSTLAGVRPRPHPQ